LERIDIQERIIIEALLDSRTTGLVMSFFKNKNQQFIIWDMIAVCSNYFVAIYIYKQTTCKLKRKEKRKNYLYD